MSRCFLLGAGASYGCHKEESPPPNQVPPMGEYLFNDGWDTGLLRDDDFGSLVDELKITLKDNRPFDKPSDLNTNAEVFLQRLDKQLAALVDSSLRLSSDKGRMSQREAISEKTTQKQKALSVTYYYLYELFRRYTVYYKPNNDYYTKLAKYLKANVPDDNVLSLNYDGMLEKAILEVGGNYRYPGTPPGFYKDEWPEVVSIPISKLHGSVNWINQFSGFRTGSEQFDDKVQPVHSNWQLQAVEYLDFEKLKNLNYKDLVYSLSVEYEPVIIPPLEGNKDYGKTSVYNYVWTAAKRLLSKSTELIIIGSRVSPHDRKLIELIDENMNKGDKITIVSGSSSYEIRDRLKKELTHPKIETKGQYFSDYMDSEINI